MKKGIVVVLCIFALLASCRQEKSYVISGKWEGGDGNVVYLLSGQGDNKEIPPIDSTTVSRGVFHFSTTNLGELVTLSVKDKKGRKSILFEADPVDVTITDGEEKVTFAVKETPEQKLLQEVIDTRMSVNLLSLARMLAISRTMEEGDTVKLDSVVQGMKLMFDGLDEKIAQKLDSNLNRMATTVAIDIMLLNDKPLEVGAGFYDKLTPEVKASYAAQVLKEKIDRLRDVNIGGIAPEIELPSPDGKLIKLSSLRGKYVLLDFWASWCGPCLREVPNVKNIYDQYHEKGFEIYGVSLDEKTQEEAWKNAIIQHEMNWVQVSSLEGWKCSAAQRYSVTGIPKMYLIDPEGRIIGMDLRGEALQEKVASLFE